VYVLSLGLNVTSCTRPSGPVPTRKRFDPDGFSVQRISPSFGPSRSVNTGPGSTRPSERVARPFRLRLATSRPKSMSSCLVSGSARRLATESAKSAKTGRAKVWE
jgi:hypothetical protein